MASQVDVPTIVRRVDSNLQTIVSSAWARRLSQQWWRRVVKIRGSDTGIEFIQWLLETAKLRRLGQGGRNVYSDMMAANFSIENEEIGDSLRLKWIELLNALGATQNGASRNALDYAGHWGRQVGAQGSDWPQLQAAEFLRGVRTVTAYDAFAFFAQGHPVNHITDPTGAGTTFDNIFYGVPFSPQNYAAIGSYIESIVGPDGRPRKVKPRIGMFGTDNRLAANQVFDARSEQVTDPVTGGPAPATNITRTLYDTEAPIIDGDLTMTGQDRGTWWIAAELQEDDQLAGMIFQERLPYTLRSLADLNDAQLLREDSYEWKFTGWNQFSAGHPFLLFKMLPYVPSGKTQWTPP